MTYRAPSVTAGVYANKHVDVPRRVHRADDEGQRLLDTCHEAGRSEVVTWPSMYRNQGKASTKKRRGPVAHNPYHLPVTTRGFLELSGLRDLT